LESDRTLQFEMLGVTERVEANETRSEGHKLPQMDNSVESLEREFYVEIDIAVQKGNEKNYVWVNRDRDGRRNNEIRVHSRAGLNSRIFLFHGVDKSNINLR